MHGRIAAVIASLVACALGVPTSAQTPARAGGNQAAQPDAPLSALAPSNLAKRRPKPPFDLTGNWFIDTTGNPEAWRFGSSVPGLYAGCPGPHRRLPQGDGRGKGVRDDIGQCWPAGLPLIMTRYWPMAMIQLPTAIYMVSGFMNSTRIVYLDGRTHTDPDVVVRTFNGESIGRWEGETLVIDTQLLPG